MKVLKIVIVMLILIMSVGAVCAAENVSDDSIGDDSHEILEITQIDTYSVGEASFTNLTDEIENTGGYLDLNQDYTFNNETDNKNGIAIAKDNFILNGNGHIIDAKNQSRIFNITANNVILSNMILKNGNAKNGGAIYSNGTLTLNNVTFTNNYATERGGAVALFENVTLNCDDVRFIDNYGGAGSSIYVDKGNLTLYNSYITSNIFSKRGQIVFKKSKINVENTTFINIVASYTPALYVDECKEAYIINSKFINLMANISAGALAVKDGGDIYIKDCEFTNTTSTKNAGAILADIAGSNELNGSVTVLDTIFKDTYSEFGGAYLQLGGNLLMNNTEFINSHATFNGGAVYLSYTESEISNCNFTSNGVELNDQDYPTYGGAVLCDISTLNVDNVNFINNTAGAGSAIYAYDSAYTIKNSLFENNINPIYTFFDKESILENNAYINDDNISTNNTFLATINVGQGMQLTLLNNSIIVTTLPTRFDLRDFGWVTPVRNQGWMGACWTFGMTAALESSLLKATGISVDFSENNMQDTLIRYSIYGTPNLCEGGMNTYGASYLLSWLGAFSQNADTYDEIGKISPVIKTLNDIHVQDVMFIPNNEISNGTQIKQAIMKYGALDVSYFGQSTYDEKNPYYNPDTYAQYVNVTKGANHEVSVVGWDDNFPKEKFLITPPGNGAWIIKNSWDTDWGDNGYLYVSYYDKSFLGSDDIADYATAIIIENTEPYNKNYQYDLIWAGSFLANPFGGNLSYYNEFEALDDDLIAAVGTYFGQSGVDYKVEIFVNDILKLTQNGVSPYLGYHTIKLNEYIPIKQGDIFKAVMTSLVMPYCHVADTRIHYTENLSFACVDGQTWEDLYFDNAIACLKVYTVENPIAENTFAALQNLISSAENYLELSDDYYFNNETDENIGISILKDNFVLNGNGHTIDAKNQSKIFGIFANNVTLSNLILINGNADRGAAVYVGKSATLDNITFIDNRAPSQGGAVGLYTDATLNINNSRFINNTATLGSAILIIRGNLNIYNTEFTSDVYSKRAQIFIAYGTGYVENVTFANIVSAYDPAIHLEEANGLSVINSKFINLTGNISSGAIGIKCGCDVYIRNCEFINTTSSKNAGAIFADIAGNTNIPLGNVTIIDTVFRDTSSEFGGAYIQLGGNLFMNNTEFINSHATFNGGAVYISYVDNAEISNCNFTSNGVEIFEGYPTYGGAMVIDMSAANIYNCRFINNTASAGSAIYAYDSSYSITNSVFENNTNPIYTVFDKESILENNIYINDSDVSTNNTFYATIIAGEGLQLTLLNNTINPTVIPTRFDLRDWGWVSPVRDQGMIGACWAFGMTGTLESALLKAAGITTDFSENNMQNTMLRYSIYGTVHAYEGGWNFLSTSYLLSWLGAFTQDADTYDELGKLSPTITTGQDIHIQDVMFTPNNEIPNGTQLKLAIMKYGSIDVTYYGQSTYNEKNPYYNPDTYAQYVNETLYPTHAVSIIGWDDSFPKEKFIITPPGDGAWIVKNSWGTEWGDNGYLYVSYYDKTLIQSQGLETHATSIIIENTEPYNKNYQYNLLWLGEFIPVNGTVSYANEFEALDDDMIAAVGTYFNQRGINYTVDIFVNDELKLTQEGISPYCGYHTIKLNEYIPIKQGDIFSAVITSNAVPIISFEYTRVHYTENLSFISPDKETWNDTYELGYIACLKVYTVAMSEKMNTTISSDVEVNNSAVTVTVNINPNATGFVEYTLNGNSLLTKVIDGKSTLYCILPAGNYTITATYLGDGVFNGNTTDIEVSIAVKTAVASQFSDITIGEDLSINLVLKDGNGNIIVNAPITYSINGIAFTNTTADDGSVVIPAVNGEKIEIQYAGNETVLPTNLTLTLNVPVSPVVVPIESRFNVIPGKNTFYGYAIDKKAGEVGIAYATTLLDANGNPISGVPIQFGVNSKIYNRTTYKNGSFAPYHLNMVKAGVYTLAFSFAGNENYASAFAIVAWNLAKKPIKIKASNKSFKASAKTKKYTVKLSTIVGSSADGKAHLRSGLKVTMKINGKKYTSKINSKGRATFKLKITKKGKFKASISYKGDLTYKGASKNVKITIK